MKLTLVLLLLCSSQETSTISGKVSASEGAAQKKIRAKIKYAGPGVENHTAPDPSPAVVWLEKVPAVKMEPKSIEIRQ